MVLCLISVHKSNEKKVLGICLRVESVQRMCAACTQEKSLGRDGNISGNGIFFNRVRQRGWLVSRLGDFMPRL